MYAQIKDAVTLSQVAEGFKIPLGKRDGRCTCPFPDCRDPKQFRIWGDRFFKCYRCKRQGSIFDLLMEFNNLSFTEAAKEISNKLNISLHLNGYYQRLKLRERAWDIYKQVAENNKDIVKEYAQKRGWKTLPEVGLSLSENTLRNSGLSEKMLRKADLLSAYGLEYYYYHLIFPVYNKGGNLVHFNARCLDENSDVRWMSSPGQPNITNYFYNSKALYQPTKNYLVLCEGVSDCLSLLQMEDSAIAQFGVEVNLVAHQSAFANFDALIAVYDRDKFEQGRKEQGKYKSWGQMLPSLIDLMQETKKPIYYLMTPDESGIKDINDWLISINYDAQKYAQYGSDNLRPLSDLAIEVYGDSLIDHSYIWSCLRVEDDENKKQQWFNRVQTQYGSLEKYLLEYAPLPRS